MKEISNTILSFLKGNYSRKIQHKPFSEKAKRFLGKLFAFIMEGDSLFEGTSVEKKSTIHNVPGANNYIPESIRTIIKEQKHQTILDFSIDARKYTISMHHSETVSASLIKQHIRRIFIWLYVASRFSSPKCSQSLRINIYFTNATKNLPDKQRSPIDRHHANTAFTTSCATKTEINIFREEEWFKVLIHETFHCMGLDFSEMNNNASDAMILEIFQVNSDVRLYETYCETWAETLNAMMITYLSSRGKEINKMVGKTEILLYYERMFSLYQCAKVLRHFHLTYDDIVENRSKVMNNFKEKTQILSYYVLKCVCIFYINDYIEWCIDNNGETLNFNKTKGRFEKTVASYVGFIKSHYNLPEYVIGMKQFENNKGDKNTILENTLRMSLFEIL
jgi:hypothetical protein